MLDTVNFTWIKSFFFLVGLLISTCTWVLPISILCGLGLLCFASLTVPTMFPMISNSPWKLLKLQNCWMHLVLFPLLFCLDFFFPVLMSLKHGVRYSWNFSTGKLDFLCILFGNLKANYICIYILFKWEWGGQNCLWYYVILLLHIIACTQQTYTVSFKPHRNLQIRLCRNKYGGGNVLNFTLILTQVSFLNLFLLIA